MRLISPEITIPDPNSSAKKSTGALMEWQIDVDCPGPNCPGMPHSSAK